ARPALARPAPPGAALSRAIGLLDLPAAPAAAVRHPVPADGPGLALAGQVRRRLRRHAVDLPGQLPPARAAHAAAPFRRLSECPKDKADETTRLDRLADHAAAGGRHHLVRQPLCLRTA